MKAISLWEPWATAMRLGLKRVETRSWACPVSLVGCELLICAAKTKSHSPKAFSEMLGIGLAIEDMNFGMAVAVVRVQGSRFAEDVVDRLCPVERALGDYTPGRHAWMCEPVNLKFKPFPVRGHQGIFLVDVEGKLDA